MKQFIDFLPLIFFFVVAKLDPRQVSAFGQTYELGGIISATAILIITSVIVYGALWIKQKSLEKSQMFTLAAVLVLGSMTVMFRDETFLKWKAPIVNWVFAVAFLGSQFIGQKPLIRHMLSHAMKLPEPVWYKVNLSWVVFFTLLGAANWFAAFMIPGDFWIDFKVFGNLGLTFTFVIVQILFLSRHLQEDPTAENNKAE
ncbi:inner membrane-spanning protein YciB [Sansalvadorimonas verongulae]|uniref:inner membrane-spanning protein YciB n=1 Tax=Sansalvadorimonas verongulae TaxID=2172824 RepID=UPI0012BBD5C5|nr:inner membrane-spanning protein YciB [Sansalvadorimonas verongulae]MTI12996.1 septation protein IspZ [Sansalvadorimonas verongulae]